MWQDKFLAHLHPESIEEVAQVYPQCGIGSSPVGRSPRTTWRQGWKGLGGSCGKSGGVQDELEALNPRSSISC